MKKSILILGAFIVVGLVLASSTAMVTNNLFSGEIRTVGIQGRQTIAVPESSIVLSLWEEKMSNGKIVPYYSICLDGENSVRTTAASYELGLRYACFDPLVSVPSVDSRLAADENVKLYIVQFYTQPLEIFSKQITSLGGVVRHYIAQFAYLVEMRDDVRSQVAALPYVRWIGLYHPAYRLEEFILDNLDRTAEMYPSQCYNIKVLAVDQKAVVADRITEQNGAVRRSDAGKFLIEAILTPDQLFKAAQWNEVLFIDRWSPYEEDMDIVRMIGGANYIETVAGYSGQGVRGEVFDTGFNLIHHDFQSRPLIQHGTIGQASHGASTSGICFGDGTGLPIARGLLPSGQGIVCDHNYFGMTGTSRYNGFRTLVQAPYYAVFQTASVGSDRTTQYTSISADTDDALFDFDIVACQSQSNAGDQMSRPQAWAKNIISVGGVYHYDTLTKTDDMWNYGGSIGPASDGTIKPDLWHFYDDVYTTDCCTAYSYTTDFGGTSAATPIVAGHVGLFFQMWSEGIFSNPVNPGGTVFENKAHMTTAKAMMINTADQYAFSGLTHDKTRMHQGWGMPNLQTMYNMREKMYIIDETDVLLPFETAGHSVQVLAGEPELKVTMTYADPAGNPAVQSQHRINDLTLKVTSPTQIVYWGNNGLLTAVWSTAGGSADTKNTVENVYIQNPVGGIWTVEVIASEIIQDGHVETPSLDADYALVVKGVQPYVAIDPDLSFVTLTNTNMDGLITCPAGDGSIYQYALVTVIDSLGNPRSGISSDMFDFSVYPTTMSTEWFGTLGCTFTPIDLSTNANGEIRFSVVGDTSIVGDITIVANVQGVLLNDLDILACKSFDYDTDGDVDLGDFTVFGLDWGTTVYRSDFTWDGNVNLNDFTIFGQHWGHSSQ